MPAMTREEFEELVAEALDRIWPELRRLMDNVAVFVEDEPPADDPELPGLYEGTPLTDRGEWDAGVLPDRIRWTSHPSWSVAESCLTGEPRSQPQPSSWSRASSIPK
ncbi:metallopeptidase family protein [Streptomyces scabiei]|uniref:metallopeptidase family protein n=1 Tax=Streptomyces scabiei TaxID=1930 RepID=UPI00298F51FE|nr:metallopeptidase family protein [Streptomyces scabiei]MDW8806719.1 metallopeptidase family protein [Streptomyces scabiei]